MKILILTLFLSYNALADTLLLLTKSEAKVSFIDPLTHKQFATLPTGQGPHEIAVSPDGETGVVTNYGKGNTLTVLSVSQRKVLSTIDLKENYRPHGVQWIGNSNIVAVTAEERQAILLVDVKEGKVIQIIPTNQMTSHMLCVALKKNKIFITNIDSGSVTVIDLVSRRKIKDIKTGRGTEGIDISPDENEVWVTNRGEDSISIIDVDSLTVIKSIASKTFPIRVKFTRKGEYALVTNAKSGDLNIYNVKSRKLMKTLSFGIGEGDTSGRMFGREFSKSTVPIGVLIDPVRDLAYVAHANKDALSVVDLKKFKIVGTIKTGKEPDGMGYSQL